MKKTYERPAVLTIVVNGGQLLTTVSLPNGKKDNVVVGSRRVEQGPKRVDPWNSWDEESDDE